MISIVLLGQFKFYSSLFMRKVSGKKNVKLICCWTTATPAVLKMGMRLWGGDWHQYSKRVLVLFNFPNCSFTLKWFWNTLMISKKILLIGCKQRSAEPELDTDDHNVPDVLDDHDDPDGHEEIYLVIQVIKLGWVWLRAVDQQSASRSYRPSIGHADKCRSCWTMCCWGLTRKAAFHIKGKNKKPSKYVVHICISFNIASNIFISRRRCWSQSTSISYTVQASVISIVWNVKILDEDNNMTQWMDINWY